MLTDEMNLISVDDHVIEPPAVFVDRLPSRYQDVGPRIVEHEGAQFWQYEDRRMPLLLQGSPQTRKFRSGTGTGDDLFARRYDDMIEAAYDVDARVRAMDEDGVTASLLFPTFPRFAGQTFLEATDKELALLCLQAWNDWILDDWCAAAPERFIPQIIVPLWDVDAASAEILRTAQKGAKAIIFTENPYPLGLPSFPTGHWAPVFSAAEETGLPITMHIGSSSQLVEPSPEASESVGIALCGLNAMSACTDLIFSGQLAQHPRLRIALSEGGSGWIPYILERLDYTWERTRFDDVDRAMRPSEAFERHFWSCFISDHTAIANRHEIGIEKLMWECDFPHNDSNWPNSRKVLAEVLSDVPDEDAHRMVELNAREFFDFHS